MDEETAEIPKGYDLETSFYHYSMDLAMQMFIQDTLTIPEHEYNYNYPLKGCN